MKDLFSNADTNEQQQTLHELEKEPPILKSEIEKTINSLKNKKSPGGVGITAETIEAMGELGIDTIYRLCELIWKTGEWPEDW